MSSEIQDYNKWTREFAISFSSNSWRFLDYFPNFESMIDEYFDNFSLLPPNESKTTDFLYRFVPEISSKIYHLSNLKDDALEFSVNQLLKILSLCVFLAEQCDFKLNKTMKLILTQTQNIYKYHDQLFSMLCELFVSYEYYQRLVDRCRNNKPNIKNLSLVFSIRAHIFSSVPIEFSDILSILPDFIAQYKGDTIRTIDSNKLNKIMQKYIVPSFPRKVNQVNYNLSIDLTPFFNFCKVLILSGNLDKKLLGIKFLNSYFSNSAKDMTSFHSWIKNDSNFLQLLEYLTQTPELHLEIIKTVEPLFLCLSSSNIVKNDFIEQIFQTTKKMEKEESNQFLKLIVKCLTTTALENNNSNIITNFIIEHKDSPEFLSVFILNSPVTENSAICVSYLFENKAIDEIKSVINNSTRTMIFDEAMKVPKKRQQVDLQEIKTAADSLAFLIKTSYKADFGNPKEFVNKIISTFLIQNNYSFVYPILASYYAKSKISLEIEILPEIFDLKQKERNDDFWRFLIDIIRANKKYSMKKDVIDLLYNTIEQVSNDLFPTSTPTFIEFFRLLYILKCAHEYIINIESYSTIEKYYFRRFPHSYFSLLTKLFFTTKEHEMMNSFMHEVLTKYQNPPILDIYKVLVVYFIPVLSKSDSNSTIKYNVIKLIYDVLITVEKGIYLEDYGDKPKRRHCEIALDVIELTLIMESKDKKTCSVIRKIHSSIEEKCNTFLKRVQIIMNDPRATASYSSITLHNDMPLKNCSVSRDCVITVTGSYKPLKVDILSLKLTENNSIILEPLFRILKSAKKEDAQLADITSKLLQFLPSYQNLEVDLSKYENYYILIYCMQIIASMSKIDDARIKSLVDIFHSRKYKEADLYVIQVFIRFFEKEKFSQYMELLIDPLFECINQKKKEKVSQVYDIYNINNENNRNFTDLNQALMSIYKFSNDSQNDEILKEKAVDLLKLLAYSREDSGSMLSQKVDEVVEMTLNANMSTAKTVYQIIDGIPDLTAFYPLFIKRIPVQLSDNVLTFKFFANFCKEMFKKTKITKEPIGSLLLQKCIECIDFFSADILMLCFIVRKTIKLLLIQSPKDDQNRVILDSDILNYFEQFVVKLFNLLYILDNKNSLSAIFRLIEKVGKYDQKNGANHRFLDIIDKCLFNLFAKVGKSSHYNMSTTKYQSTEFTGLQNLGSTCFINTIVQPLFYTYQLRFNVLFNKDVNDKNLMYDLFSEMLITQRGYVKMKEFVSKFSKDIETNRQQDCVEFLLILSEKLDKRSYNLFKGVLVDHFTSSISASTLIENDSRDEDFIHLSVNVQKFTNLEDSLKSLFGSSVVVSGNDLSATSSGSNLSISQSYDSNLQKYSRIKVAPQFLMICLNRFEYNLKTFQKIKINSKFSFPFVLDITEYIEPSQTSSNSSNGANNGDACDDVFADCGGVFRYELYAVSLHNGSADSGHYTALVKVKGNWIEFNDRSSRKITEKEATELSFGTNNRKEVGSERNAYVLYYRRILVVNQNGSEKVINLYDENEIDQVFLRFSEKMEKKEHLSIYEDASKDNFKNYSISSMNSSLQVLISYFFNVYCHSAFKDSKEYVEKLIKKLNDLEKVENINSGDTLFNFLLNQSDGKSYNDTYCPKLIETFLKCKNEQILVNIRYLILTYSDHPKCRNILTLLISNLSSFMENPEKIDTITPLFLGYVTNDQTQKTDAKISHIQIAREMSWGKKILEFIDFCSTKLAESKQSKMRLSDLLILLKDLLIFDVEQVEGKANADLAVISKSIVDSVKKNIKFLLMNSFNSLPLLELFNTASSLCTSSSTLSPSAQLIKMIEDTYRSDTKNKLIMSFIIGLIECDANNEMVSDCLTYEMEKTPISPFFKDYLRSSNSQNCFLNQYLVDNYEYFILPELLDPKRDTRLKAEHLTYDIFVEVKPPKNSPQYSNSRSTQNRLPTENLIRFSKLLNDQFFKHVFGIINEMTMKEKTVRKVKSISVTTTSCSRSYESYFFENFLRVVKWTVKRVKNCNDSKLEKSILTDESHYLRLFNQIYDIFVFINSQNSRSSRYTPDGNYRSIIDIFKILPYEQILMETAPKTENNAKYTLEGNEVVEKVENVINDSIDLLSRSSTLVDEVAKFLLIISTVNNNDKSEKLTSSNYLLLRIYEKEKFVNFFRTQKSFRQDITLFEKFYSSTFSTILENSELYRKEVLSILDNPLNYALEYSLLTTALSCIYHLLPGKFILKVMQWIIKNVNDRQEAGSFMETVMSINSSVRTGAPMKSSRIPIEELFVKNASPLKVYSSQPVSSIKPGDSRFVDKNCDFIRSFDNIGYKAKMKCDDSTIYFTFVKYICHECQSQSAADKSLSFLSSVPDEILMKLINRMSLIDGKNVPYFGFELSSFFDLLIDQQKFDYVVQFINGIFPLSNIQSWFTYTKIFDIFLKLFSITIEKSNEDEIILMNDSLFLVAKNLFTEFSVDLINYKSPIIFLNTFLKDSKPEIMMRMINELVSDYNAETNANRQKIIVQNLKKIIRWFPLYSEYTKKLIKL